MKGWVPNDWKPITDCGTNELNKHFLANFYLIIIVLILVSLLPKVCGHAKAVTALDVAEHSGLVMTTSEDTFVRVWQLDPSGDCPVS